MIGVIRTPDGNVTKGSRAFWVDDDGTILAVIVGDVFRKRRRHASKPDPWPEWVVGLDTDDELIALELVGDSWSGDLFMKASEADRASNIRRRRSVDWHREELVLLTAADQGPVG